MPQEGHAPPPDGSVAGADRPLKILFHHRIASRDGQSVHMDELIGALTELGHEVVAVGPARVGRMAFGGKAGVIALLKRVLPRAAYELLEFAYNMVAFWRLRRAYRTHRPDAVYERYNMFMLAGLWLHRLTRTPLLLEVNGPLFEERAEHGGLALHRLAAWSQRATWRGVDRVLPVTGVLAGYVRAAGVPEERITVIPNGINARRFEHVAAEDEAKRRLGLEGRVVLGFTGFVRTWHALDRVIDLLAAHGARLNLHLLLVGDGPARDALERQALALGVTQRLTVTGIVGRDDVAAHIAAFDIALQPGVTPYASPLKLFEYMVLGRAIVAPDMPNIREVLTDEVEGILFDPDEPGALNEAILRLAGDAALRSRVGGGARAAIDAKGLVWTNNATRVTAMIRDVIAAG